MTREQAVADLLGIAVDEAEDQPGTACPEVAGELSNALAIALNLGLLATKAGLTLVAK